MKDTLKEGVIGGVVIAAVVLAGLVSLLIIFNQPYGKAFQMQSLEEVTECTCRMNGVYQNVLFSQEYVLTQDGRVSFVGGLDANLPACPQVCAKIGAHAV